VPVKKIENRSIFGRDMEKVCGLLFWGHPVFLKDIGQCCRNYSEFVDHGKDEEKINQ